MIVCVVRAAMIGLDRRIRTASTSVLTDTMIPLRLRTMSLRRPKCGVFISNLRGTCQAQIMLGMVPQPKVRPKTKKASSQSQSTQLAPEPKGQNSQPLPVEVGQKVPAMTSSRPMVPARQQNPVRTTPSAPQLAFQLQPNLSDPPLSAPQIKGFSNALVSPAALSQSSQTQNVPMPPPAALQFSVIQPQFAVSSRAHVLQTPGQLHQPPPPPLPPQPRPPSVQSFSHQLHSQVPHGLGFQQSSKPLLSRPIFLPGKNTPSFPQGQPPLPIQPPSQQHYQAQILLGMVPQPKVRPNTKKASSQSQSTQLAPEPKGQNSQPLPVEVGFTVAGTRTTSIRLLSAIGVLLRRRRGV